MKATGYAENVTGADALVREAEEQLALREGRGRVVKDDAR